MTQVEPVGGPNAPALLIAGRPTGLSRCGGRELS